LKRETSFLKKKTNRETKKIANEIGSLRKQKKNVNVQFSFFQ